MHNGGVEVQNGYRTKVPINKVRVCKPEVENSHHFDDDPDSDPDQHQSNKSDPDLHQSEKWDPDPHQSEKRDLDPHHSDADPQQ